MTSLSKQWQNSDLRETKQNIYHSKIIDESCPKVCFLLNLSHCVKSYGHFCQILAVFTMPAHQIWSCHVTQDANFEIFYFALILHLILEKVTTFPAEKPLLQKLSAKNFTGGGGGKHPPHAYRINEGNQPM